MKNDLFLKKAKRHLVGGVNSPVRSFKGAGVEPLVVRKGKGPRIYDYDGKSYIDYVLSYGALILGHAYPDVIKSLKTALEDGLNFGATCSREIELAGIIAKAIPFIKKIRFVNSGTEGVLSALRLARAYTGRSKVIKFREFYHGHADYLLDGCVDYGDRKSLELLFKRCSRDIAGVIVEPVGGNKGVILPDIEFLKHIRKMTKKYNSLLIFDEVITGFRFRFGSSADMLGVEPDLICLGKIIGGGLPIGAYGGREDIMNRLAPLGGVYQGSTFAGNPIVMQSGISTLKTLKTLKNSYRLLEEKIKTISGYIEKEAEKLGIGLEVTSFRTMFSLRFARERDFQVFYKGLLEREVYLAPSQNEANFISFSHTERDIDKTICAIKKILEKI